MALSHSSRDESVFLATEEARMPEIRTRRTVGQRKPFTISNGRRRKVPGDGNLRKSPAERAKVNRRSTAKRGCELGREARSYPAPDR
jgi:hypothetical protein